MKKVQPIINKKTDYKVIAGKFEILKKVKSGGFGSVYFARGVGSDHNKYAVKLMQKKNERFAKIEAEIYQLIKEKKFTLGFIKHYDSGFYEEQLYLAMELIGLDLDELMSRTKAKCFSMKTVLMIGIQVIDRIQALHTIEYIHRDIKPDNLAIGRNEKNNVVYLFDFGLAVKKKDPIHSDEKGKMMGTMAYMSLRIHEGKKASYVDDIQSFVYTLMYLATGNLPWMQIHIKSSADYHRVKIMKEKLDKDWFKKHNVPIQILEILKMVRENENSKIDYLNIKYKILSALKSIGEKNDFAFEWCGKNQNDYSPNKAQEKKKVNQANQQNQKVIQNEIYQIYKFMNNQDPNNTVKKQENLKIYQRNKKKVQQKRKQESLKKIQVKPKEKVIRPNSANKNIVKVDKQKQQINEFQRKIDQLSNLKYEGPKIMINMNAIHRL